MSIFYSIFFTPIFRVKLVLHYKKLNPMCYFWFAADSEFSTKQGENEIVDRNCECCAKAGGACFIPWLYFQNFMYILAIDPLLDLFITICIVLNTALMASEHIDQPQALTDFQTYANYVRKLLHLKIKSFCCLVVD